MIRLQDNSPSNISPQGSDFQNLQKIANLRLDNIKLDDYPNLLVFPQNWNQYRDDIHEKKILSLTSEGRIQTSNIMGFIGINETRLTIASRFSGADERDYFLHYMLSKVLSINLLHLDTTAQRENIHDFLPYLFPYYLKKALSQGLYKRYIYNRYNDAHVRGAIDVARHIRANIPFAGKVAYKTREFSYNNEVTQLARHTIEHLRGVDICKNILSNDPDMRDAVLEIEACTPTYNKNDRAKIIHANRKPLKHPYFTEYRPLQKLCLQILRSEKVSFGGGKDNIHGILFDGAWLWEEYLNTLLKEQFRHPRNKSGTGGYYLFTVDGSPQGKIYPDFVSRDEKTIADAKYQRLEKDSGSDEDQSGHRGNYYQLMAYMYRFNSKQGYLIFPCSSKDNQNYVETKHIIDTGGRINLIGLSIPTAGSLPGFSKAIEAPEKAMQKAVL